jgi:hypothetical protein
LISVSGWGGIRTLGTFRYTRFPGVPNRPLWHPSRMRPRHSGVCGAVSRCFPQAAAGLRNRLGRASKEAGERLPLVLVLFLIKRLNERLKFGLEFALALLDDFQLQLVPMQLNRRVVNVALDFGQLRLALAQRPL